MPANKKVLAISIDFDGCLGSEKLAVLHKALLEQYGDASNIPSAEYDKALIEANQVLIDEITRRAADFDEVVLLIGTNRQFADKDKMEGDKHKNGSAYKAISHLANIVQKNIEKPVLLNKRVVFDTVLGLPPGYNFDNRDKPLFDDQSNFSYGMSGDYKYRLSFLQMNDLAAWMPNADISFIHVDDKDDIRIPSEEIFKDNYVQSILPPNVKSVEIIQYEPLSPGARFTTEIASKTEKNQLEMSDKSEMIQLVDSLISGLQLLLRLCEDKIKDLELGDDKDKINKLIEEIPPLIIALQSQRTAIEGSQDKESLNQNVFPMRALPNNLPRTESLPDSIRESYIEQRQAIFPMVIRSNGPAFTRNANHASYSIPPKHFDLVVRESTKDDFSDTPGIDILKKIAQFDLKEFYKSNLAVIRYNIENSNYNLHGGRGVPMQTKAGTKRISNGAADVLKIIDDVNFDSLETQQQVDEAYVRVCRAIHQALDGKTQSTKGIFGIGARDHATSALYRIILDLVGPEMPKPQSPLVHATPVVKHGEYANLQSVYRHRPMSTLFKNAPRPQARPSSEAGLQQQAEQVEDLEKSQKSSSNSNSK